MNDMLKGYQEIVVNDVYRMNDWDNNYFDTIIDIGANVGMFILYASIRNPNAKIFAYEPCVQTYKQLEKNTFYLSNVKCFNAALGNGSPLFFYNTGSSGHNLFYQQNESELPTETTPTVSYKLTTIFNDNKINGKYFIKIDCEGGERFLLEDKENIEIINNSHALGMEIHFPPKKERTKQRFKTFPTWKIWNDWIYDNFNNTHNIDYHNSSSRNGTGVYSLSKRKL